jgi:hypothetical protein
MYSLPIIVTGFGMLMPPTFPLWPTAAEDSTAFHALMVTGVITAVAAAVWLLSPLRLQAELGVLLIVLAFVGSVLPWSVKQVVKRTAAV